MAVEEIDVHHHPMRHYSVEESDTAFGFIGQEPHLDADLVDSVAGASITTSTLPVGIALFYSGTSVDFTNGYLTSDTRWHVCDGGTYSGIITPAAVAGKIMIMRVT